MLERQSGDLGRPKSEYAAWENMKSRCYYPGYIGFKYYGGRGIKVCERWLHSFEAFLEDMGRKPTPRHTLGRKDGDGDYTPENCEWQTWQKQNQNRSMCLAPSEVDEIRMLWNNTGCYLSELARRFRVSRRVIRRIVNNHSWLENDGS